MAETITARYESGVLVPLENLDLREHQTVRLQIVPQKVCITASEARRKVSRSSWIRSAMLWAPNNPHSQRPTGWYDAFPSC